MQKSYIKKFKYYKKIYETDFVKIEKNIEKSSIGIVLLIDDSFSKMILFIEKEYNIKKFSYYENFFKNKFLYTQLYQLYALEGFQLLD